MNSTPAESRRTIGRRTSDAVLRRALEIAHLGWWQVELRSTTDLTQNVPTWSDEVFRIFGHEPKAFAPSTERFFAQVHPDDHAAVNAAVARAFADNSEYLLEHRIVRADGAVRLVEERASIELDESGKPVRMVGTITDVTDRRRIEAALRGDNGGSQLLTQLVEHSHDAIISAALDGAITTWNPAAERMFGWRADEVIGRQATMLLPPDRHREAAETLALTARGQQIGAGETVAVRRDGTPINVALSISPIFDASGTVLGASGIVRDVTQQKRLAAQVQHAQRLESVGRLAGGVAHDFNNLLMAMSSYAELVLMDVPEDAPAREDLRAIIASAERGAQLTRQLLAFGRRQVLHPAPFDLNSVLRDMDGVLHALIAGDATLQIIAAAEPCRIRADRAQVEQVVVNLVANARDAMPHGGAVTVATSVVDVGGDGPLPDPAIEPGRYVLLAVRDEGIGMDAETQSRLFEPFFSTKARGTSTGMGLAAAYGVVKQSGGFITVQSTMEFGSTFRVYFPQRAGTPVAGIESIVPPPARDVDVMDDEATETVLLVEDDESVRRVTRALLERIGFAVIDVTTPAEALTILRDPVEHVDVLLTDVILPDMRGTELARIARNERRGLRVVCMSGFPDAVGGTEASEPTEPYLQKPFSAETLARALRAAKPR